MDTSITWCRDHGWAKEFLPSCHFYPAIGSVFYIDGEGGPTAIFNQTSFIYGMQPLIPNEIGIIYPKKNQMLLFKGNRYHGVMKKNPLDSMIKFPISTRKTLLINYWSVDKIAGESITPTLDDINEELILMKKIRDIGSNYHYYNTISNTKGKKIHEAISLSIPKIMISTNFLKDLQIFKDQIIPKTYIDALKEYKYNYILNLKNNNYDKYQLQNDLKKNIITESVIFVHNDNTLNNYLAKSGSVFGNWDKWYVRNITEERLNGNMVFENDYTYTTPLTLDINIPPHEKGLLNPILKLAQWRKSMPGGDPHENIMKYITIANFTNEFLK